MGLKPYIQGDLDGYCGVYSIVNASRLIHRDMTDEKAELLFRRIMIHVEQRKKLSLVSTGGICIKDMEALVKELLPKDVKITGRKPFRRSRGIRKAAFFKAIQEHLEGGKGRAVIANVRTDEWDHWTVVKSVSRKDILFFDSSSLNRLRRDRCRIGIKKQGSITMFLPRGVFFLWRIDGKGSGKGRKRK